MTLSVIIVNYNTGSLTSACLESILKQGLPFKLDLIVVDNASSDESVSFLRSDFPEVKVIANETNDGFGAGVNIGLKEAKGDYQLILNPDVIVLPGALEDMVDYMEDNQEVGILGGKLVSPNGDLQYSCFRYYRPMTIVYRRTWLGKMTRGKREIDHFLMKDFDHRTPRDVDWLMGSCLMVRDKVVNKIGGMDERFFMYFEDVDWCRRVWEVGWRVRYFPKARFSHYYQRGSQKGGWFGLLTNRVAREHIKSALKYFAKYRGKELPQYS